MSVGFSLICLPSPGLTAAKKIENETGAGVVPLRLFCSHLLFPLYIIFFKTKKTFCAPLIKNQPCSVAIGREGYIFSDDHVGKTKCRSFFIEL